MRGRHHATCQAICPLADNVVVVPRMYPLVYLVEMTPEEAIEIEIETGQREDYRGVKTIMTTTIWRALATAETIGMITMSQDQHSRDGKAGGARAHTEKGKNTTNKMGRITITRDRWVCRCMKGTTHFPARLVGALRDREMGGHLAMIVGRHVVIARCAITLTFRLMRGVEAPLIRAVVVARVTLPVIHVMAETI